MNSKAIKSFLTGLGMKVRIRTNPTKNPYIWAWVTPDPGGKICDPLKYSSPAFSEDFRRTCLGVIYGFESDLAKQTAAGNVSAYAIAMRANEWEQAIDITLNRQRVALP